MARSHGYRRRTRSLLKKRSSHGLSHILTDYAPEQKVVIKIDSTQVKGMPHRRFNGLVGVVRETGRRAVIIDVNGRGQGQDGHLEEGAHRPTAGGEAVELSAEEAAAPSPQKKMLTLSEAHQILEKIDVEKADQIQKRTLDYTIEVRKEHA